MPLSPEYIRAVLAGHFENAKTALLEPLVAIHQAHLVMLAETGIVSRQDAQKIRGALDALDLESIRAAAFDGASEDLFFHIDRLISDGAGAGAAGRLHTARSRNDIDMTMYRMRLRGDVLALLSAVCDLRRVLLGLAAAHVETVFPAHTHTQPAQPTTLAHYLLAVVEERERDATRLQAAYRRTNQSPLGACAITGTGFPIDRARTSELLGFDSPTGNTYGSIATVDHVLEACGAALIAAVGLGRFVQDMLLWCTAEVGYLRLPDDLVQVSSIMPQKRNPVALEHGRAMLSMAVGQLQAVPVAVHNTPFGDVVDTEDDLQPLVATAFRDVTRGVTLAALALAGAEFDRARMRERAGQGWVAVTELADTLARDHGLPFRAAHAVASRVVGESRNRPGGSTAEVVRRATEQIAGRAIVLSDADIDRLLSPDHFVRVRRTSGGPAPELTRQAIEISVARLDADVQATSAARRALDEARWRRQAAVAAL